MGSLARSEEMALCQLFLQSEAAYTCVSELGELGVVQFRDLNPSASAFQRKFVVEVRRCDEMERKLRYIEKEIKKDGIPILDTGDNPDAPASREMAELEATLEKLEVDLREVTSNAETLRKNFLELTELKHVLTKAQNFFEERDMAVDEAQRSLLEQDAVERQQRTLQISFLAGVVARERVPAFERMLWRACRGAVYIRQAEVGVALQDPVTGVQIFKTVFVAFFQGEQLKIRVKKICDGFHATLYPCPDVPSDRKEMIEGVATRIGDLNNVLEQTHEHRQRVLILAAKNIRMWFTKVRKIKAIYHTMNMFNLDVTQKCLIAECWCACSDLEKVQLSLLRGTEHSGSSVPSILNRMASSQTPPTLNRTNKFTAVYQAIVDAYGVANYREINPAPFSIITFPFLFSIMFGDFGHGLIAFVAAAYVVARERQFAPKKGADNSEIWGMFYAGRYLIALMGLFSIYAGLVYNDAFSKSVNVFGSSWRAPLNVYDNFKGHWTEQQLSPRFDDNSTDNQFLGAPYPFGLDPLWAISHNKITFTNSFKMKLSVILGVTHMMYGVCLSAFNHAHFTNYMNMFCEFIPQVLFLACTFGYLVVEIIFKWIAFSAQQIPGDPRSDPGCAPSLLIGLINMYLFKYSDMQCGPDAKYYAAQEEVQTFLIIVVAICIPWMLVPKPYLLWRRGYAKKSSSKQATRRRSMSEDGSYPQPHAENGSTVHETILLSSELPAKDDIPEHDTQESLADIVVHQCIHTIEYCLGCVSHTASYLRLWALSLAHAQLSEVLWNMVLRIGLQHSTYAGAPVLFVVFVPWAILTVSVLLLMEGLSAFLHTLRLHWVEFQDKFYDGEGYKFHAFSFDYILNLASDEDDVK